MRGFSDYHPIAAAVYYLITAGIAMFCMNPAILILSLIGAVLFYSIKCCTPKGHIFFALTFIVSALINPLVYHNGATVLFMINDSPITFEALAYGICAAAMIVSALYWFGSFSKIMTSDKLLCIFGGLSPKLSLVLSMALRYVPLFGRQSKKVSDSQKAIGLYKEDNAIDGIKGGLRVFSVMTTWALENGIITADSMAARGYGTGRRSRYSKFRFGRHDTILVSVAVLLGAVTVYALVCGSLDITFYPVIAVSEMSAVSCTGTAAYGVLCLIPSFIEIREVLKWKYLLSKI